MAPRDTNEISGLAHAAEVNARRIEREMLHPQPDLVMAEGHARLLLDTARDLVDQITHAREGAAR